MDISFWETKFEDKKSVQISEFLDALYTIAPSIPRHVANELTIAVIGGDVSENPPSSIEAEKFGAFLTRFSPAPHSLQIAIRDFIDDVGNVYPWFHGKISREQSHERLQCGYFLCRYSGNSSLHGNLIISTCTADKKQVFFNHQVVMRSGGTKFAYRLGMSRVSKPHRNLQEFIQIYFPNYKPLPNPKCLKIDRLETQLAFLLGLSRRAGADSSILTWSKETTFEKNCIKLIFSYLWKMTPFPLTSFGSPVHLNLEKSESEGGEQQYHVSYPTLTIISSQPKSQVLCVQDSRMELDREAQKTKVLKDFFSETMAETP